MIERLNQISLYDFIEISCNNYTCLVATGESATEQELKKCASKLITDYRNLVNPTGMKALLLDREETIKCISKLLLLQICNTLLTINCCDEVKEILRLLGVNVYNMDVKHVKNKVDYMLHSAIFEQRRNEEIRKSEGEEKKTSPDEIRKTFDSEVAFLMTYFKMNIDSRNINAAVYANIVHQADIEIDIKKKYNRA